MLSSTFVKAKRKIMSFSHRSFVVFAILFCTVFVQSAASQEQSTWPRFRGPDGTGVSTAVGVPTHWSETENIAWKTEIPGSGWSSPIVWKDHIFVTATTEEGTHCHVLALDRSSGKVLWNKMVFTQEARNKHVKNTDATPTPVTDGETVYALFSSGGFVALDFKGNVLWENHDVVFYSQHGLGTSPILYKDLLITSFDPSFNGEPKGLGWQTPWDQAFILALDKATGKERWRGKRGMSRIAHTTPLIVNDEEKDLLLSNVGDVIQGADPNTGELLWTIKSMGEGVVPSPAFGENLFFTASGFGDSTLRTVKLGGKGDCTDTHIAWEVKRNVPSMASILYVKPCLYVTTDGGTLACLEAATGKEFWQKRIRGALNPSPLFVDGKLYILSEQGTTTVLKLADDPSTAPEEVAKNELGEQHALASIAVAGKQLLIRTDHHLWCIGTEEK